MICLGGLFLYQLCIKVFDAPQTPRITRSRLLILDAVQNLSESGLPMIGCVLNGIQSGLASGYGYGGYGYGYGYGYGTSYGYGGSYGSSNH